MIDTNTGLACMLHTRFIVRVTSYTNFYGLRVLL